MAGAALVQAAGWVLLAFAVDTPVALAAAVVIGIGNGLFYPGLVPLLTALAPAGRQPTVFSLRYLGTNVGIGLGAALGGIFLARGTLERFQILFFANAATFVAFGALLLSLGVVAARRKDSDATGGFLDVLRNRRLLALVGIHSLIVAFGYAQLDSSVPLYARVRLGVSTHLIGLMFALNTAVVVLAQIPAERLTRAWRRSSVLVLLGVVWLVAWAIGGLSELALPAVALFGFYGVFAVGETLFSPSFQPLLVEASPPELLGRSSSVVSVSWSAGSMVGPTVGALLVSLPVRGLVWPCFAAAAAAVALASARLGRSSPGTRRFGA
jgi:MFS family permease